MADLTQTAASVVAGAAATKITVVAGGTITRGMPVYKDSADDEYKAAQATSTKYAAEGVALNDADDGQPLEIVTKDGSFTPGATLVVGVVYAVSATAGKIAPVADLVSTDYTTVLGVAKTTSVMKLDCQAQMRAEAPIA